MELQNGRYKIGGLDVLDLCQQYDTPIYIYDFEKIAQQYERLVRAFSKMPTRILYACKALNNQSVLRFIKQLGCGVDCVSIQEVWLALRAGFAPNDIMYTPNCVSFEEIRMAVELGVKINIDNISILEQFGNAYGDRYPVCLRINPHIFAGGNSKISVGHIDSKFGVSVHLLRHVERVVKSSHVRIEGLHMHTGSDILDIDVFLQGADILMNVAYSFPDLQYIDFGSGFKVPYKPNDNTTDIELLGVKLAEKCQTFYQEYGRELTIFFEPGKYLVSESGILCVKTNVIKHTTSTVFAGVDSGLNHLIRPMMYDAYHHIVNLSNPEGIERFYSVVGYICETDTFAWDRKINEIHEGDILALLNAGAYGYTMASNYNARFRPLEVAVFQGQHRVIRQRDTLETLLAGQVEVDFANSMP